MGRRGREPPGAGIREAARLTGTECPLYCVQLSLILGIDEVYIHTIMRIDAITKNVTKVVQY